MPIVTINSTNDTLGVTSTVATKNDPKPTETSEATKNKGIKYCEVSSGVLLQVIYFILRIQFSAILAFQWSNAI